MESYVDFFEREMHSVARVVRGCPFRTWRASLMVDVGIVPVEIRRDVLSARLACNVVSQRARDHCSTVAVCGDSSPASPPNHHRAA